LQSLTPRGPAGAFWSGAEPYYAEEKFSLDALLDAIKGNGH
jgi:hypothetical protein